MKRSALKFYVSVVSILSIAGIIISGGILGYNILNYYLVTDQEYINGSGRSWDITNCDAPIYGPDGKSPERTPDKIAQCKKEATERVIRARAFELKQSIIGGATWFFICLLVFLYHYRKLQHLKDE